MNLTVSRHVVVLALCRTPHQPVKVPSDLGFRLVFDAPRLAVDRLVLVDVQPAATRVPPEIVARIDGEVHATKDVGRCEDTVSRETVTTRFGFVSFQLVLQLLLFFTFLFLIILLLVDLFHLRAE